MTSALDITRRVNPPRAAFVDQRAALVLGFQPDVTIAVPGGHLTLEHSVAIGALLPLLPVVVPDRVAALGLAVVEQRLFGLLAVLVPGAIPVIGLAVVEEDLGALV